MGAGRQPWQVQAVTPRAVLTGELRSTLVLAAVATVHSVAYRRDCARLPR
jgi:hypothetical protein